MGLLTESFEALLKDLTDHGHEIATQGLVFGDMPFAYVDTVPPYRARD